MKSRKDEIHFCRMYTYKHFEVCTILFSQKYLKIFVSQKRKEKKLHRYVVLCSYLSVLGWKSLVPKI